MTKRAGTAVIERDARTDEWILCLGHERPVVSGLVRCPIEHGWVDAADCSGCHLLVTRSGEREDARACGGQ